MNVENRVYPDPEQMGGREVYHRCEVEKLLHACGGRVLFTGDVSGLSLGRVESVRDEVALAEYPSRAAVVAMATSPEWRAGAFHRAAGLEGQLKLTTLPTLAAQLSGQP